MLPKKLALAAVLVVVAVCSLRYGFLAAKLELPPYKQLKSIADSKTGQTLIGEVRGWLSTAGNPKDAPAGRWRQARQGEGVADISEEQLANLEALGYLSGTRTAPELIGVTGHDVELAYQGLNLYNSGHSQMAVFGYGWPPLAPMEI